MKYTPWSNEVAEKELTKRFRFAAEARKPMEELWSEAERAVYAIDGGESMGIGDAESNKNGQVTTIGTNRINHHVRYKHSQLATNPPIVLPRPTSNDPEDHRKASTADKLAHYALRQYAIQDTTDSVTLSALIYGMGYGKCVFNPDLGEIISFDEESGEVKTDGDFEYSNVSPWNLYPDPDASTWRGSTGVKWLFEELYMDYEQACHMWPDQKDLLESFRIKEQNQNVSALVKEASYIQKPRFDVVRILQYWERGLPYNGLIGRYGWAVTNGTEVKLLEPIDKNPHAFSPDGKRPGIAGIPYELITDQDVPGTYWGRSDVMFAVKHQDARNMLDTAQLDILKAHGVARLVVFGNSEFNAEQSITNSPLDIIVVDGNQKPDFINPVPLPQGMVSFTEALKRGEDEIFSINEAMQGIMNRETAGTAMQYATQNGNSIRYRIFIKYTKYVEEIYKTFFNIVKKHWDTKRTIKVVGKEKAYEVIDIKGTDIDGGFDVVAEFGTSFSLDPMMRRQEIMTMSPMLKEAGISTKAQLKYMRFNQLDAMYDRLELGNSRQQEIFTKMCETLQYIPPEDYQDHASMVEYAQNYVMTAEFSYLPKEKQALIIQHKKAREEMAGKQAAGAAGAVPPSPGTSGMPPMPAAPAASAGPAEPPPGNLMDLLGGG
jgi:hypothetical protein